MTAQKLDYSEVEQMLRSGHTQQRVVDHYARMGVSVTQPAVSMAITSGRINVDTERGKGGIPWALLPKHRHLHAARMLRTQARLDAGLTIGESLKGQVANWREALVVDDSVIHYDPETMEGFWRVPRRPGIDLGWVREPTLNDDGTPRR